MKKKKNNIQKSGQAVVVGLMILVVSGIFSFGVIFLQDYMNKQRRALRVNVSRDSLSQEIEYILKNPLSYSDFNALQLHPEIIRIVDNLDRKIAGIPCGKTGNDCKIQSQFISSEPLTRIIKYKVEFLGTSPRIKVKEYSFTLSATSPMSNQACTDPTKPLLDGIDSSGNPICRPLANTSCGLGQYLIGISQNLSAICADIEDRNISVPAGEYIKSYQWTKTGNILSLNIEGAPRQLNDLVAVARSFEFGPVSFFPRPGTDFVGPTVGNTYFPRKDSKVFKCPDAYPLITFKSVTGNSGLTCNSYVTSESSRLYQCSYAKGDYTQREVKLTYECSKRP